MKYLDPSEGVFFPALISVRAETAALLREMADEMGTSLDELLSAIAEDSVSDLAASRGFLGDVIIPDSCSKKDLMQLLE